MITPQIPRRKIQNKSQFYKKSTAAIPKTTAAKVLVTDSPFAPLAGIGLGIEVGVITGEVAKVEVVLEKIPPGEVTAEADEAGATTVEFPN